MFIHTKKTRLEVVVYMRNEYTRKGWVFLPLVVENFYTLCAVDCCKSAGWLSFPLISGWVNEIVELMVMQKVKLNTY